MDGGRLCFQSFAVCKLVGKHGDIVQPVHVANARTLPGSDLRMSTVDVSSLRTWSMWHSTANTHSWSDVGTAVARQSTKAHTNAQGHSPCAWSKDDTR